jgi:hypothetical protein
MNDDALTWRKSRHSGQFNNCVEVATLHSGRAVRDSKDRSGPVLMFSAAEWSAFTNTIKTGQLD